MALGFRPMRRDDIPACVHMVAAHPILAARFGAKINLLDSALTSAWPLDSVLSIILEDRRPEGQFCLRGAGIIGFVTDEFLRRLKTPPYFWIGPEVTTLTANGRAPFLSDVQLKFANSLGGLNVITWLYVLDDVQQFQLQKVAMDAYRSNLRGFRLNEIIGQATLAQELDTALNSGALLLGEHGKPVKHPTEPSEEVAARPHVFCMTQGLVRDYFGTWTSLIFTYQEPILGFARSEQRLIEAALRGLTDEELGIELQISLSAVKKTWRSIYSRVDRSDSGILPASLATRADANDRGKGKKHRLLSYVREHPEELRPVSLKLLRQPRSPSNSSAGPQEVVPRHRVGRRRGKSA
jgi:DNA-binding NarL/FixJ family response regulator